MKIRSSLAGMLLLLIPVAGLPAETNDLNDLRKQLDELKHEYEQRISALEARLNKAEQEAKSAEAHATAAEQTANDVATAPVPAAPSAANTFNPSIGVILNGHGRAYSNKASQSHIAGFSVPDEGLPGNEGLSLGESELNFYANVDDKFYGSLTTSLVEENGKTSVSVEEAYLQTLALPAGLTLKAGRFFSNIGYLNPTHTHADDFEDRPLPYRAFLNSQFGDDGVQVKWLAPTDLLVEVGGELLRGSSFPAGGGSGKGKGMWTAFAHVGGDVGISNSWRAGISYVSARADDRESGDPAAPDIFNGDSRLWIADFVWKWAPNGNVYNTNFKLQGEYLLRRERGLFTPAGGAALPLSTWQDGFYVQGIYQFMPQWRFGLRYSQMDPDNPGPLFAGTSLDSGGHTPWDLSAMVDWSNSEFSRVRLQYNRDASQAQADNQFILQYIMSLGAHGAHVF